MTAKKQSTSALLAFAPIKCCFEDKPSERKWPQVLTAFTSRYPEHCKHLPHYAVKPFWQEAEKETLGRENLVRLSPLFIKVSKTGEANTKDGEAGIYSMFEVELPSDRISFKFNYALLSDYPDKPLIKYGTGTRDISHFEQVNWSAQGSPNQEYIEEYIRYLRDTVFRYITKRASIYSPRKDFCDAFDHG